MPPGKTRLLRQGMARTRTWKAPSLVVERERSRQIARLGGGIEGRGGATPRQPLPGTREAWPQRVSWLPYAKRTPELLPKDRRKSRDCGRSRPRAFCE